MSDITVLPNIFTIQELVRRFTPSPSTSYTSRHKRLLKHLLDQGVANHTWLAPIAKTNGFIDHLYAIITQSQRHGLNKEQYKKYFPGGSKKADAILSIIDTYKTKKASIFPQDIAELLNDPPADISDQLTAYIRQKSLFLLGYDDIYTYEKPLLSVCLSNAITSSILLPHSDEHPFYTVSADTLAWIDSLPTLLRIIPCRTPHSKPAVPRILKSETIDDEMHAICEDICRILEGDPTTQLSDIGIVVPPENGNYAAQLRTILPTYHLHSESSESAQLQSLYGHPLSSWLTHLFSLLTSGFDRRSVLTFLSHPLSTSISDTDTYISLDISLFKQLAIDFNIQESIASWHTAFKTHLHSLTSPRTRKSIHDPGKLTQYIDHVRSQYSAFKLLARQTYNVSKIFTGTDLSHTIHTLFEMFNVKHHTTSSDNTPYQQRIYHIFMTTISTLCDDLSTFNNNKIHIKTFLSNLPITLKNTPIDDHVPPSNSVSILEGATDYLNKKKHLYICGVSENFWPLPLQNNPCCPIKLREKIGWPSNKERYDRTLFTLLCLVGSTSTHTIIATPSYHTTTLIPSHMLDTITTYFNWGELTSHSTKASHTYTVKDWQIDRGRNSLCTTDASDSLDFSQNTAIIAHIRDTITSHTFSASELEAYQRCPRRYYHQYLLKEENTDAFHEDIAATTWGTLVHTILQRFYSEIKNKNGHITPSQLEQNRQRLMSIANTAFNDYAQPTFYWEVKRQLLFGDPHEKGLLDIFLDMEITDPLTLKPAYFERGFKDIMIHGSNGRHICLSGTIDVVLEESDQPVIAILDYKTGASIPSKADITHYRSLQLPLYALAAKHIFPEKTCVGGIIYQIRNQKNVKRVVLLSTKDAKQAIFNVGRKQPFIQTDDYFEHLIEHLLLLKEQITNGRFSSQPFDGVRHMIKERPSMCKYCDLLSTCDYKDRFK